MDGLQYGFSQKTIKHPFCYGLTSRAWYRLRCCPCRNRGEAIHDVLRPGCAGPLAETEGPEAGRPVVNYPSVLPSLSCFPFLLGGPVSYLSGACWVRRIRAI